MTEPDELLAALDFEPSMCWVRSCIEDAVSVARPGCNCWTWPLCAKHDEWLRGLLTAPNTRTSAGRSDFGGRMTLNRYAVEFAGGPVFELVAPNIVAAVMAVTKGEGRLIADVRSVDFLEELDLEPKGCVLCGSERVPDRRPTLEEALAFMGVIKPPQPGRFPDPGVKER